MPAKTWLPAKNGYGSSMWLSAMLTHQWSPGLIPLVALVTMLPTTSLPCSVIVDDDDDDCWSWEEGECCEDSCSEKVQPCPGAACLKCGNETVCPNLDCSANGYRTT